MRKALCVILVVVVILIAAIYILNELQWVLHKEKPVTENPDRNLEFIGNGKGFYYYGDACSDSMGNIFIASLFASRRTGNNFLSLMKLAPDASLLWEKRTGLGKFSINSLLPLIIKNGYPKLDYTVCGVNLVNGKLYVVAVEKKQEAAIPLVAQFDLNGKLLGNRTVSADLKADSEFLTVMQNNYAYLSYKNPRDKLFGLVKIDVTTGKAESSLVKFYKQKDIVLQTLAPVPSDSMAAIAVFDPEKGLSSFYLADNKDILEIFRTQALSMIKYLKYYGDKLYCVAKEDSLLEVVNISITDSTRMLVSDVPKEQAYEVTDFKLADGTYYVLMYYVDKKKSWDGIYTLVKSYDPSQNLKQDFLVQGNGKELSRKMFISPDGYLTVIGTSMRTDYKNGFRIYASRFKL